jgi:ABC-type transporter Mla MlaB component
MTEMVLSGRIAAADVPQLCERARLQLERSGSAVLICEVGALADPDATAVDALARLQLTARRLGGDIRLRHASPELLELLDLFGLSGVVPAGPEATPRAG